MVGSKESWCAHVCIVTCQDSIFFLPIKGLKKMALGGATYSLTQGEATYHKLVWFTILIMDS